MTIMAALGSVIRANPVSDKNSVNISINFPYVFPRVAAAAIRFQPPPFMPVLPVGRSYRRSNRFAAME